MDVRKLNLDNVDVSYGDFTGANFGSKALNGTILTGANLSQANVRYVAFYNVKLTGAKFNQADLFNSVFRGDTAVSYADLTGTGLAPAATLHMNGYTITGRQLVQTVPLHLEGVDTINCHDPVEPMRETWSAGGPYPVECFTFRTPIHIGDMPASSRLQLWVDKP